ncbi:MAG: hypothetical protein RMK93_00140 [Bacteroidota bacterium]|nr:hypothetical protein [Bacteroidota bacterium]
MQPLTPHPEIEHLRHRRRELRSALRQTLQEWFRLRTEVYPELLATYENLFRDLEVELQRISLHAAQLRRCAELLILKLQRGEPISERTFTLVDHIVEREFAQLRERLPRPENPQRKSAAIEEEIDEFPKLYRLLVKRLHPDATGEETKEFRRYWPAIQQAYREKNIRQLRQLHLLLCGDSPDTTELSSSEDLEALRAHVRQLEQRLQAEQRRLERLRAEEPFCLPLTDPVWIAQRRHELEQAIQKRHQEIAYYTELLARIRARTLTPEEVQSPEFSRRFAEHTYGRR